jgi:membrane-associated phospholipid phosphatase
MHTIGTRDGAIVRRPVGHGSRPVPAAVNQVPVHVLNEPRPYAVMSQALVLVTRSNDPSAPSDHAVVAAAVATGLIPVTAGSGQ